MKRYKVVGRRPVYEHMPGAIFERDIPPDQEARLLARGDLKILPVKKPSKGDEQ